MMRLRPVRHDPDWSGLNDRICLTLQAFILPKHEHHTRASVNSSRDMLGLAESCAPMSCLGLRL
jgi:hypothetical protein